MMTHTAAAYFATLPVAFAAAKAVARADFDASSGVSKFRKTIELFNNVSHVELFTSGFATFRGTRATAEGVARYGFEVRHMAGDKYMAKRSRIGVVIVDMQVEAR